MTDHVTNRTEIKLTGLLLTGAGNHAVRVAGAKKSLQVKADCAYLAPSTSSDYEEYVQPPTSGLASPLINGRSSGGAGPDIDLTEPLNEMERIVKSLKAGDFVYLAAWFFEPTTRLQTGHYHAAGDWGNLFAEKAREGVTVRIIINDFDPISHMDQWLQNNDLIPLNGIIMGLPAIARDRLKYIVSLHPAHIGYYKSRMAGQGGRPIHVASHHQKFMVARRGDETFAFCGGLDIESRKTPENWDYLRLIGWHDVHVKLQGAITYDLMREFVERWNREKDHSTKPPLAGWSAMETLSVPAISANDSAPAKNICRIQMLRTVSVDSIWSELSTERTDIKTIYKKAIGCANTFLHFENQYFRSAELAEWVVERGLAHPDLLVMMVVVASAGADYGANAVTELGDHLQYETFDKIVTKLGSRARLYTMMNRAVHSKFLLVDDKWMTIGSANANVQSFELDSELNIAIADDKLVADFRRRLWAHNLGTTETAIARWAARDFLAAWDAVANANKVFARSSGDWHKMSGEGILPFDYRTTKGKSHGSIPDAMANLDMLPDGGIFAGDKPSSILPPPIARA